MEVMLGTTSSVGQTKSERRLGPNQLESTRHSFRSPRPRKPGTLSRISQRIPRRRLSDSAGTSWPPSTTKGNGWEWVRQSREGRAEAFALLVRQHQRMVHSLTYRMTGSLAEAEDLAQEAFVRAWQHLDSFAGQATFSTWLCRIAMNACLNWRHREGRRNEVHHTWANHVLNEDVHPDRETSGGELNQRVQAALNRLPAKQRAALVLTVCQELSHAEAAHALGCTEAPVSWRVFAARGKLKRWLNNEVKP
jgi:RNA polymerase sigma-70 factor (ECF subfamily)